MHSLLSACASSVFATLPALVAVRCAPEDPKVLDAYGCFLFNLGEHDSAKSILATCEQLQPHGSAQRLCQLAQVSHGQAAVNYFGSAIAILKKEIHREGPNDATTAAAPMTALSPSTPLGLTDGHSYARFWLHPRQEEISSFWPPPPL
eukprot:GHVU01193808.1.p1 GENE.GHVU01193808.1~~GHVU01193808.1.p1  ORF type:complete len:148 (-),score=3.90 GHVU01193808.1:120-563(-)